MIECKTVGFDKLVTYKGISILKPKDFDEYCKSNDATIIGRTYLKNATNITKSDVFVDTVMLLCKPHPVFEGYTSGAIGFIPVDDHHFIALMKRKPIGKTGIISAAVVALACVGLAFAIANTSANKQGEVKGVTWNEETDNDSDINNDDERIAIPGYVTQRVTEEKPTISLGNPKRNDVYFTYHISDENGKEIYTSDYISPGMKIDWNAYEDLPDGTNTYRFLITTCDMVDTTIPYNSAEMTVEITK